MPTASHRRLTAASAAPVRVWDLPTRLFHWLLVACVTTSIVTGLRGGSWLEWHFVSGHVVLYLLVFRLLWGLAGDRYARFSAFPPSLRDVITFVRHPRHVAGHSPLGAWSTYTMLLALALQAATGLFANDAIFMEGPFAKFVSGATSDRITRVHSINRIVLIALITMHLAALTFYRVVQGLRLVSAMVTGDKIGINAEPAADDATIRVRALLFAVIATALVEYLLRL